MRTRTRDDYHDARNLNRRGPSRRGGATLTTSSGAMTQLTIEVREAGQGQVVVVVAGEVDMATAPVLERALLSYRDCGVLVDLSAVGFLDSSGLTVLVQAYTRLQQAGHTLRTTGEREVVLTVMRIAGLLNILHGSLPEDPAASRDG